MRFIPLSLTFLALLALSAAPAFAQDDSANAQALGLLPQPQRVELREGRFQPGAEASVAVVGAGKADARDLGELAASVLREGWGVPVKPQRGKRPATLTLTLQSDPQANAEGYALEVDAQGLRLSAPTAVAS